jgi:hypothetical protein
MPTTERHLAEALRRLLVATLAYAVAVAGLASAILPSLLSPHPAAALLPKPPPVVARSPHTASTARAAP